MCAEGHRPICQDTGIAVIFLKVGMDVHWDAALSVQEMCNEGVRRAYNNPDNKLRASVLLDPAGARKNSRDNTPAVVHYEIVPGHHVEVSVSGAQLTLGHSARSGGVRTAGPEPSRWKCAWRVAAQFGIIATGRLAACVG